MSSGDMTFEQLLKNISPEIYKNLQRAVELGKWTDGSRLTPEQREHCMHAMMAWEVRNLPEEERTGYMEQQCKSSSGESTDDDIQPLNLTQH